MAKTYYLSGTNSDLSGGADFDRLLDTVAGSAGTISVSIPGGATRTSYGYTAPLNPSSAGISTGTFSVEVNVTTASTETYCAVSLARVDASGVVQATTSASSEQTMGSTGVKAFTFSSPALGTWSVGDRLRVAYIFRNGHPFNPKVAVIGTGTANEEVSTPFPAIAYGALVAQESGPDTFSATGTVTDAPISGTMAAQETGADTFAGLGFTLPITGTMAAQESGVDTAAIVGLTMVDAVLAAAEEGADSFNASGAVSLTATMFAMEATEDDFSGLLEVPSFRFWKGGGVAAVNQHPRFGFGSTRIHSGYSSGR